MKALLLAAGYGTRLKPLTDHIPKCLVNIKGKPLLEYWLELLCENAAISEIIVNTHYLPDQIRNYFANTVWPKKIKLAHEEILLGTAGTVLHNFKHSNDEHFLVAHADNLTRFDVNSFIEAHKNRAKNVALTMMTFDTDAPQSCGIVELDSNNIVIDFHEKSPLYKGIKANAAVYIVESTVIDFLKTLNKPIIDLSTEVLPHYLEKIQTFHNADYHRDIGTPESLALAQKEF